MKYCCKYSNNIKVDTFQEISIQYNRQDRELIEFLKAHKDVKINLIITDIQDFYKAKGWQLLNAIKCEHPDYNFSVCFGESSRFNSVSEEMRACMDNLENIPYFTGYAITNFEQLNYILKFGISEVYLAEEICFDLRRAKSICKQHRVSIRAYANIAQSNVHDSAAMMKFFIRPEDVTALEQYIDVLEFWGSIDRQEVLLRIYSRGVWFGDLQDLILDFNFSLDSRRVAPDFAYFRANCERKCLRGDKCDFCTRILSIAQKLEQQNLFIREKRAN